MTKQLTSGKTKWIELLFLIPFLVGCYSSEKDHCAGLIDCFGVTAPVGVDSCLCFETTNGAFEAIKLYRNDTLVELWQNSHYGYIVHLYPQEDILDIQGVSQFYRKAGIRSRDAAGTDGCLPLGERIFQQNCRHCHIGSAQLKFSQLTPADFHPKFEAVDDRMKIFEGNDKHYILRMITESDSSCLSNYLDSQN